MSAWSRSSNGRTAAVLALLALTVVWLPGTVANDLRGLRSALRLSSRGRAEMRGPAARAGTDLTLLRMAEARIPAHAPYAVLMAASWRRGHSGTARESGGAWTQFALAPRVQVGRASADWVLVLGSSPGEAGLRHPLRAWRSGGDWLVQTR